MHFPLSTTRATVSLISVASAVIAQHKGLTAARTAIQATLASAALALSATWSHPARAGFSPGQLSGFEVTEMHATVKTALPEQRVLEVVDAEGHTEILTTGIDLAPLKLQAGDQISISILDGLVVDLTTSQATELSFNREDIILPESMGPLRQGMRVALASGTARVVSIDRTDRNISLLGPLGGIHNLDVLSDTETNLFEGLKIGDIVDFRLIQPLAINIDKLTGSKQHQTVAQTLKHPLNKRQASLKQELLESFEISHLEGSILRIQPDNQVLELQGPEGESLLLTSAVPLRESGFTRGTTVQVDLLAGLVVDLSPSRHSRLHFQRDDLILSNPFGPLDKGTRISMATGTAEVVRLSRQDNTISLRGPVGRLHNLDLRRDLDNNVVAELKPGDLVDFSLIQPVAIAIKPVDVSPPPAAQVP